MPLAARLGNVLVAPGEAFAAVARSPFAPSNWLVPALLLALVGLLCQGILFSQPALVQQVREMQDRELQRRVEAGAMSPAEAEKARQVMGDLGITITRVAGAIGAVLIAGVGPLWWGFLAWAVARWGLRSPVPYLRAVEVSALASLIGLVAMLVGTFLAVGTGKLFAGAHLGMVVSEFDPSRRGHLALGAVNLFSLWHLGVLSLGLARVSGRSFTSSALGLLGLWVGYKALAVVFRLAQFAL